MNNENENNQELEVNRQKREDYEKLMKDSSTQLDGYWDSNNAFVKLILLILGLIIIVGIVWTIMTYKSMK